MKIGSLKYIYVLSLTAALLSACGQTNEAEGTAELPPYTTASSVKIIYDTAPPYSETEYSRKTSVSENTVPDLQTLPEETEPVTQTVPSEISEETTVSTSISLSLEDVPDVGISEYYLKTQTQRTVSTQTSPSSVPTSSATTVTTAPSASPSETSVSTTVPTAAEESSGVVTVSESGINAVPMEPLNEALTDGRISSYTGREIISHPYSYYTLTDKYKGLYDKMVSAMLDYEEQIHFDTEENVSFQDIFDIYQLVYNDEYRLFYISPTIEYLKDYDSGNITEMKFSYNFTQAQVSSMRARIESEADGILSKITPLMNDYDMVKLFHDSVITSCEYKETDNQNTVYGCLVEKQALCQGYSRTFTYLCSEAGIDSFVVLGVAGEPHMWNVVKMDGDYYHIDLTWDDPDNKSAPDSVRYDYFGITDERIRQLRQVDDYDYAVPAANGTKYQYYQYNNLVASSYSDAKQIIEREAAKASETKSSTVQFMCYDDTAYNEITGKLFSSSGDNVIGILSGALPSAVNKFDTDSVYHNSNKSTRTVKIFLTYAENG